MVGSCVPYSLTYTTDHFHHGAAPAPGPRATHHQPLRGTPAPGQRAPNSHTQVSAEDPGPEGNEPQSPRPTREGKVLGDVHGCLSRRVGAEYRGGYWPRNARWNACACLLSQFAPPHPPQFAPPPGLTQHQGKDQSRTPGRPKSNLRRRTPGGGHDLSLIHI